MQNANESETVLYEGYPALLPSLGALLLSILTVGLALLYYWIHARSTHYRVTSQRVVVDRGIFSKQLDQVDLYRIQDYRVERPVLQRMMGTGNVLLFTQDRSSPALRLYGMPVDVVQLYEQLRAATEVEKRRRGVRVLDESDGAR